MKKILMVLCLLLIPVLAAAAQWQAVTVGAKDVYAPVGVVVANNAVYISSMGPSYHKNLDGYIVRYDLNAKTSSFLLQNQINSPKSFTVFEDRMLIIDPYAGKNADGSSLFLASLSENRVVSSLALNKDATPHDIVTLAPGVFAVSDSSLEKLYLVTVANDELKAKVWAEKVPGLKGLAIREGAVYAAGTTANGETACIYVINPATCAVQEFITAPQAKMFNAVAFYGKYLLASDWGSKKQPATNIYVFNAENRRHVATITGLPGPSGITIAGDVMYLPLMTEDRVVKVNLNREAFGK